MANIGYTNTPLIAHLYDTSDAALAAASELGCNGYRTYNINGENKYVPCSSFVAYERAIQLYKIQGNENPLSGNNTLGDNAVGLQFTDTKDEVGGNPYFTLGNFSISNSRSIRERSDVETGTKSVITKTDNIARTAESINENNPAKDSQTSAVEQVNKKIEDNVTVNVLFDKKKLENYVAYSPLKDSIKNTIIEITRNYPAALKLNVIGLQSPTASEYNYSERTDTAQLKLNLPNISNPFGVEYTSTGTTISDVENVTPIRNFSKTYREYTIYYKGIEYPIINATLPASYDDNDTGIYLTIEGDPFSEDVNLDLTLNRTFWVKPKYQKYDEFQKNLSDMGRFLLDYNYDKKAYVSLIRYSKVDDNGVELNVNETLVFPQIDEVNLDLFSNKFDSYITKLNNISDDFDSTKTNLISRFLTTDSLKEFDTDDRRFNLILNLMGKNLDKVRKYVDGITYMTRLSYDKIENIPDLLTKNYGNMLGFETYNVEDDKTIMESIFNLEDLNVEPGLTPAEIDIELWRRIFINSYHLWKSKGTRKSIEFILNLVGLPDSIFDVNEHVYVARQKLDFNDKASKIYGYRYSEENLLKLLPIDLDGYPTVPSQVKYQESGFNLNMDNKNYGPYDFGNAYIKAYEQEGSTPLFKLDRYTDNVKSWVFSEERTLRLSEDSVGYTEYYEDDSRLVINSKELEVYLSSDKIFDFTLYRYLKNNNVNINTDLMFPQDKIGKVGTLSFNQFMQKCLDDFIKPENRKTIKTYPTLSKIYYDYLKLTDTPVTNTKSLEFLNKFDGSWVKLVQQFTPATTILNAGKKIQNSKLLDNKFIYKHGLNDNLGWLGTDGSEFQNKANLPVNNGFTNPFDTKGDVKNAIIGDTPTFNVKGYKGLNYTGYDPSINEYFGFYYGIQDACNTTAKIYEWDGTKNYGDDSLYDGNINVTGETKGIFVKYEDTLYRLNTNRMFSGILPTIDTTVTHKSSYIVLDNLNNYETIALPNGPGEYLVEFDHVGLDTIEIYDGATSSILLDRIFKDESEGRYYKQLTFTNNQITVNRSGNLSRDTKINNLIIDLVHGLPTNFKVNNELVYQSIGYGIDSNEVFFYDSPTTISTELRDYYVEHIGIGHADLATDTNYICPVPEPHVCYFDYYGKTINMSALGYTSTTYDSYLDETDKLLSIKQPRYYGYSKDIGTSEPEDAVKGSPNNWVVPYKKYNAWTLGETYYKDDVVNFGLTNYIVDNPTVIGTSTTPTGCTPTTIIPGIYQSFMGRTKTDPYMHIDHALIGKKTIDGLSDTISFNLTKDLYLYQVFSGSTSNETYRVIDNILNDELYISDSTTLEFDGFYSLDDDKVGPFYQINPDEIMTQTLEESINLIPDNINFINIRSLNENFNSNNEEIGIGDGFYLVKKNCNLKFEAYLYFESTQTAEQSVLIRLQDQFNEVIHEQIFSFSGTDESQDRVAKFATETLFSVDTKVYLTIIPETVGCKLSRYEKIDIDYTTPTTYSSIDDPRFRVSFNAGRTILDGHYVDDALSISPVGVDLNYDVEHYMFRVNDSVDRYKFRPKLSITNTYDESNNFGLIFGKYFNKYKPTSAIGDVSIYEKNYNNDKFDLEFVVNSKYSVGTTQPNESLPGVKVSKTIKSTDNYLGNTPQEIENTGLSTNIIFGKEPKPRTKKLNKTNYPFLSSNISETIISSTPSTIDFIGYDDGLSDYDLIDYSGNIKNSFLTKRRYKTTTGYWKRENKIYNTDLYQNILNEVPEFSEAINNYQINDIVKVTLLNTDYVLETEGEDTIIETRDVERLYVCVEDINEYHLEKSSDISYDQAIHPIYRPNGARTCFIPIEEYDLKSFTPIGYDKHQKRDIVRTNQRAYTYEDPKILTGTVTDELHLGDIVRLNGTGSTYNLYQYTYNKPLKYDSTKTDYKVGNFVYHKNYATSTDYSFYIKIDDIQNEPGTANDGWARMDGSSAAYMNPFSPEVITSTDVVYPSEIVVGAPTSQTKVFGTQEGAEWDSLHISGSSYRVPNLLPTGELTGFGIGLSNPNGKDTILSDMIPNYIDEPYLTNNQLDGVDNIGLLVANTSMVSLVYSGTTTEIYSGYTLDTNLIQNDYTDLLNGTISNIDFSEKRLNTNIPPLFELMCSELSDNGIYEYDNSATYDVSAIYNSNKYVSYNNVLYRSKVDTNSGNTPNNNINEWEESDFMLVKKYTLYKDRTSVKIYDGDVVSLNDSTKSDLFFFDENLTLKDSFTNKSFSGSTHDNKLTNALNKLTEAKNENLRDLFAYGLTGFRKSGSDIIMDYFYDRDSNGLPKTGEFIGGLTISNPCGHEAKVIFGTLFDFDETQIELIKTRLQSDFPTPRIQTNSVDPTVRLLINQNGASQVTLTITDTDGTTTNKTIPSNTSIDDSIITRVSGELEISVKYDIFKNSTRYKEGYFDEEILFDDNDEGLDNSFVKVSKNLDSNIETRVIKIKDIQEDRVVRLDFEGANFIELATVDPNGFITL